MFQSRSIFTLLLISVLLFCATFAFGQGIITGSISGTVQDAQGAVVSGAKVTARHVDTGTVFTVTTNETGYFQLFKLPPGGYGITIEAATFRTFKLSGTAVSVAQDTNLGKIQMQIGAKSEVVEVTGAPPLVETQTTQLAQTFDSQEVTDLPIGRGIDQLALFLPGVATAGSVGRGNNNGALFSANGQRPRSNNFQIDGQGMNDQSVSGPSIFLENNDLVAEYQVMTNYDAAFGRNMGSQVNIITKSGSNAYHGTASETWRGSKFDSLTNQEKNPILGYCMPGQDPNATGCSKVEPPSRYVRNVPTFTVGGPIKKDKAWFFASGLWDRTREAGSPTTSGSTLTPTKLGISQMATLFPNSPGVAFLQSPFGPLQTAGNPVTSLAPATAVSQDPTGTGYKTIQVCAGGGLPYFNSATSTYSCNSTGTAAGTPTAGTIHSIQAGTLVRNVGSVSNTQQYSARGDVQLTQKDRIFGRYLIDDEVSTNLDYGDGAAGFFMDVPSRGQQFGLDWTRQWSNTLYNQVRFNWTKLGLTFGGGTSPCTVNNPDKCPVQVTVTGGLGMGLMSSMPQGRANKTYEWQDNASWTRGKHTFKLGFDWSKQAPQSFYLPSYNGAYAFSNWTNFLNNVPSSMSGANGSFNINYHENDIALYFQDDVRVSSTLTVTAGLRWEFYQNTINQLHDQSVAQQTGPNPFWDKTLPLSLTTIHPIPEAYHNFGPVLGFSWSPREKAVVRGGFRIAYDPSFYNIQLNLSSVAPVVNSTTITVAPIPGLPSSGFDGTAARPTFSNSLPVGTNPGLRTQSLVADNFHNPYSEQWNFGVQYEVAPKVVVEARYLGNHSVGLFQNLNGNIALNPYINNGFASLVPAGLTPCTDPNAPGSYSNRGYADCNRRNVGIRTNTGSSSYNGLQTQLRTSNWRGVSTSVSYTWSHAIDNASDIYSTTGAGMLNVPQDPFNGGAPERGNSNFDYRHTLGLQLVYEFPFYQKQQGVLGKALGGWQANVTYRYSSGQPYTPIQSRAATYMNSTASPDFCDPSASFSTTVDACRPILANPTAPFNSVGYITAVTGGVPTVLNMNGDTPTTLKNVHWLVNNYLAAQYFGNPFAGVGRNTLNGQPINATNLSMQKDIKLTERINFQFRATAYNVLNHMFLGVPGNNIMNASSSFGNTSYNSSGGGNASTLENGLERRRLEFGGKITF